jgi:uncharacterized membrane protein
VRNEAVISLAGIAAEHRAAHPSVDPGWVALRPSPKRRTAIHEAGHVIAALRTGNYAYGASVVPNGRISGLATWSRSPDACDPPAGLEIEPDVRRAARIALLLVDPKVTAGWKAILAELRKIRQSADELIAQNWIDVVAVADALERHEKLDRSEIERLV